MVALMSSEQDKAWMRQAIKLMRDAGVVQKMLNLLRL